MMGLRVTKRCEYTYLGKKRMEQGEVLMTPIYRLFGPNRNELCYDRCLMFEDGRGGEEKGK